MHVHFIAIKIGIVRVAVGIMHANCLHGRICKHTRNMRHDTRFVQRRLTIHQDNVTRLQVTPHTFDFVRLVGSLKGGRACEQGFADRSTLVGRSFAQIDQLT